MPPATGTALIILGAFVLPGFVTVLLQELTFKSADDPTPLDRLLRILWYSVWSYLLVAVIAIVFSIDKTNFLSWYHRHTGDPALLVLLGALLVMVTSVIIATATLLWSRCAWREPTMKALHLNPRHKQPTGWDHFFQQRRDAYVRATFADGSRVLGYYGDKSFAAYAKDGPDLFLERVYVPNNLDDEWFGEVAPDTCGIWVKAQDAVSIEFYAPVLNDEQRQEAERQTEAPTESEAWGTSAPAAESDEARAAAPAENTTSEEGQVTHD